VLEELPAFAVLIAPEFKVGEVHSAVNSQREILACRLRTAGTLRLRSEQAPLSVERLELAQPTALKV